VGAKCQAFRVWNVAEKVLAEVLLPKIKAAPAVSGTGPLEPFATRAQNFIESSSLNTVAPPNSCPEPRSGLGKPLPSRASIPNSSVRSKRRCPTRTSLDLSAVRSDSRVYITAPLIVPRLVRPAISELQRRRFTPSARGLAGQHFRNRAQHCRRLPVPDCRCHGETEAPPSMAERPAIIWKALQ
jgi:hypothetical protein